MSSRTHAGSPYMEFAKLRSAAKYNLATSGIMSYPLAELPVKLEDLEINWTNLVRLCSAAGAAGRAERSDHRLRDYRGRNVDGQSSGTGGHTRAGRRGAGRTSYV